MSNRPLAYAHNTCIYAPRLFRRARRKRRVSFHVVNVMRSDYEPRRINGNNNQRRRRVISTSSELVARDARTHDTVYIPTCVPDIYRGNLNQPTFGGSARAATHARVNTVTVTSFRFRRRSIRVRYRPQ